MEGLLIESKIDLCEGDIDETGEPVTPPSTQYLDLQSPIDPPMVLVVTGTVRMRIQDLDDGGPLRRVDLGPENENPID